MHLNPSQPVVTQCGAFVCLSPTPTSCLTSNFTALDSVCTEDATEKHQSAGCLILLARLCRRRPLRFKGYCWSQSMQSEVDISAFVLNHLHPDGLTCETLPDVTRKRNWNLSCTVECCFSLRVFCRPACLCTFVGFVLFFYDEAATP